MFFKPFKPPQLNKPRDTADQGTLAHGEPPTKRRRVSDDDLVEAPLPRDLKTATSRVKSALALSRPVATLRNPLLPVPNPPHHNGPDSTSTTGAEGYYMVLWRKYTTKKHKTWDGDGVLAVRGGYASLHDISGRDMGRVAFANPLLPGSTMSIGGKDIEVDSLISEADFLNGKPFSKGAIPRTSSTTSESHSTVQVARPGAQGVGKGSLKEQMKAEMLRVDKEVKGVKAKTKKAKEKSDAAAAPSQGSRTAFKNPLKDSTTLRQAPGEKPVPRHDPNAPDALVMRRPKTGPSDKPIVDVVVDPLLASNLRPHQQEGVAFLYECVMGIRDYGGEGCILADEMGLGKTLQSIALLWTLLKQSPFAGCEPVIKKALIVCPVTLINNWQKEFRKWLGNERIGVFVADGKKTRLTDFTMGKSYSVMVIGYERLRSVAEDLTKGAGIDIVIADEGHRLKTVQNKSAQAIQSLNTSRRIILSGTPIQNDLSEFFSMVNFVNDGLLGSYKQFVKNFENPIVRSRQPEASKDDVELGQERSAELARETSKFILRRTADILSKYLPPKTEYVVFCEPTQTQAKLYRHILASPMFQSALGSSECALQLITILKKVCNSPSLLSRKMAEADATARSDSIISLLETLPPQLLRTLGPQASAKIRVLDTFLYTLSRKTSEKVVLVSNYTSTLDLLQNLLSSLSLPWLRLDGSTPSVKRQGLVDDFNRSSSDAVFAFLLSAKAGGLGLNLIGANRLVLFDVDWNPAVEEQAMARIHREGQKKPCRIYRFVLKGGLEERVWQRQVVKRGLANSIMDGGTGGSLGKKGVAQFSKDELRDLFRLDERAGLRTHDLIGCACEGRGPVAQRDTDGDESGEERVIQISGEDEDDEEIDNDDDEDNLSLPDFSTLVRASTSTISALNNQQPAPKSKSTPTPGLKANAEPTPTPEMRGLADYTIHLDASTLDPSLTSHSRDSQDSNSNSNSNSNSKPETMSMSDSYSAKPTMESYIDDEILMDVLRAQVEERDDDDDDDDDDDAGGGGGGGGDERRARTKTITAGGVSWVFVKR